MASSGTDIEDRSGRTNGWATEEVTNEEAMLEAEIARLKMELEAASKENSELTLRVKQNSTSGSSPAATIEGSPGLSGDEVLFPGSASLGLGTDSQRRIRTKTEDSGYSGKLAMGIQHSVTMIREAEDLDEVLREAESEGDPDTRSVNGLDVAPTANFGVIMGSAIAQSKLVQTLIYAVAIGGLAFVLVAKSTGLGDDHHDEYHYGDAYHHYYSHGDSNSSHNESHANESSNDPDLRRLGAGPSLLATNMAYSVGCAGLIAFFFNLARQPLFIGYIAGGILIGPLWGLDIVADAAEIADLRSLGLIFLCFMIGLEMDLSEIPKMGRTVIVSGILQLPVTAAFIGGILIVFNSWGMDLGGGNYPVLYCAITGAFSSTMLVVKQLTEQAEMDSFPGRMTVGILFFQDIWAIFLLAVQPELDYPKDEDLLRIAGMIALVSIIALVYARFVMPAVYQAASKSVELMLVLSLAWCFFMCCLATLPSIELSMELAALISGVALATFPYSMEFNSKIKYIRDFFVTFFFAGLGMLLPSPTFTDIATAIELSVIIVLSRCVGVMIVGMAVGSTTRTSVLSTINLCNLGEFALVICSLGTQYNHIDVGTLKVVLWAFMILAIFSNQAIPYNYRLYKGMWQALNRTRRVLTRKSEAQQDDVDNDVDQNMQDRVIILLGFHKIAAMLIAHWEHFHPALLRKVHVIDFHEDITNQLLKKGIHCTVGDISSIEVIAKAHPHEAHLVICSIPDTMLRGVTNQELLKLSKEVWPKADVIVTADNQGQVHLLYEAGADYVLRMAKLCAERLHELIIDHSCHAVHHHHHQDAGRSSRAFNVFEQYKRGDQDCSVDKKQHIVF